MKTEISDAIVGLRAQFPEATVTATEDGSGGAYVIVDPVRLGGDWLPETSWIGGHLTAQYPYADVYPVFVDGGLRLRTGTALEAPITAGHSFNGRPALQVSRRTPTASDTPQTVSLKFLKVLKFMETRS